jgi:hypothetical protein
MHVNDMPRPSKTTATPHEVVHYLSDPGACYSFDSRIVGRWADGTLFWSQDSGCSCPCPFDNAVTNPLSTMEDFEALEASCATGYPNYGPDGIDFLRRTLVTMGLR